MSLIYYCTWNFFRQLMLVIWLKYNTSTYLNRYLENKMKLFIFAILLTISLAEKNDWPCPSEDVNFSGHDVERVDGVDSWSECGQICNVYPNCKYWTYEPSGWVYLFVNQLMGQLISFFQLSTDLMGMDAGWKAVIMAWSVKMATFQEKKVVHRYFNR